MYPYSEQGDAMFPHRWGMQNYNIGEWQVERMPTKNFFMDSLDWEDYSVRTLRHLQFTCQPWLLEAATAEGARPALDILIDGIMLVGPDGAQKLLDKFDDVASDVWGGNTSFSSERAPRGISKGSMIVHCRNNQSTIAVRPQRGPMPFAFNISEFTHMQYRWKIASTPDPHVNATCGCASCPINARSKTIGCDGLGSASGFGPIFDYLDGKRSGCPLCCPSEI